MCLNLVCLASCSVVRIFLYFPLSSRHCICCTQVQKKKKKCLRPLIVMPPQPVGSGDSSVDQVLHSWSKGRGLESRQERQKKFLLRGQLSLLGSFPYPFHLRVAIIARKNPCHSAKSGRLHLNTHALYVCHGVEWSDTVNGCMVAWCTQNVRRDGSSFTWHQPCNNQAAL